MVLECLDTTTSAIVSSCVGPPLAMAFNGSQQTKLTLVANLTLVHQLSGQAFGLLNTRQDIPQTLRRLDLSVEC